MVMFVFGLSLETQFGCVHLRIVYLQNSWASLESGHVFEDYEDRTKRYLKMIPLQFHKGWTHRERLVSGRHMGGHCNVLGWLTMDQS